MHPSLQAPIFFNVAFPPACGKKAQKHGNDAKGTSLNLQSLTRQSSESFVGCVNVFSQCFFFIKSWPDVLCAPCCIACLLLSITALRPLEPLRPQDVARSPRSLAQLPVSSRRTKILPDRNVVTCKRYGWKVTYPEPRKVARKIFAQLGILERPWSLLKPCKPCTRS